MVEKQVPPETLLLVMQVGEGVEEREVVMVGEAGAGAVREEDVMVR